MSCRSVLALVLMSLSLWQMPHAHACFCSFDRQPIAAFKDTPVVFIGTVTSRQADTVYSEWFREQVRTGLTAYFSVDEPLKGISTRQATVITGGNHGGCGMDFEQGQTYVVFAWPQTDVDGRNKAAETTYGGQNKQPEIRGTGLQTSICTLTRELRQSKAQLEMIRGWLSGNVQPLIHGTVYESGYAFDGWYFEKSFGPMRGIKVVAARDGQELVTSTDENGSFFFKGLKPGAYSVKAQLPASHWAPYQRNGSVVELKSEQAYELHFMTKVRGWLGGKLIDSQGRTPTEQVELSLIRLESADKPAREIESRGTFARNGRFYFDAVPAGKYVIGISVVTAPSKNTPYGRTFFPQGAAIKDARVFELKTGEVIDDLVFNLPLELETLQLKGIAITAAGEPVANASLELFDAETPGKRVFGFDGVKTDAVGRFTVTGFKNRSYLLHAWLATEFFERKGAQSRLERIPFDGSAQEIRMVLDQPGISIADLR